MNNDELQEMCMSLIHADSEDEVIGILSDKGFWDDESCWRLYGDLANNYSVIGNQQPSSDKALVEKLVNSIDARLMRACMQRGIDPKGPDAPESMAAAVNEFVYRPPGVSQASVRGQLREWPNKKRLEESNEIAFVATGSGPRQGKDPCFTIVDSGEGQTPNNVPGTFLSIARSNKTNIPFVQGKFNAGGTGVLAFCGEHNLQLIVTKRDPELIAPDDPESAKQWSFTLVRKVDPTGSERSSSYYYLAPLRGEEEKGGILRFTASDLPLFPDQLDPYARRTKHGTLIKLYEYRCKPSFGPSQILLKGGALRRLDLLLPEAALPIRLHELRVIYTRRGKDEEKSASSYSNTLTGLATRLEENRADNLEYGFPVSSELSVGGEHIGVTIYCLAEGTEAQYKDEESVLFVINGQTHATVKGRLFQRKSAPKLSYVRKSILILADCTGMSVKAREALFMNNRSVLREGELRDKILEGIAQELSDIAILRRIDRKRREQYVEETFAEDKRISDVLNRVVDHSPTLAKLLGGKGQVRQSRISETVARQQEETDLKRFPTIFRLAKEPKDGRAHKRMPKGQSCRIQFITDVVNDYFSRAEERGMFTLHARERDSTTWFEWPNYSGPTLVNGQATLTLKGTGKEKTGDAYDLHASVTDPHRVSPLESKWELSVSDPVEHNPGGQGRHQATTDKPGDKKGIAKGLGIPNIHKVRRENWEQHNFDEYSALKVMAHENDSAGNEPGDVTYDFFVNVDNVYLDHERKNRTANPQLATAQFTYGIALLGMAILSETQRIADEGMRNEEDDNGDAEDSQNVEDLVRIASGRCAPVIVPMIQQLGQVEVEDALAIEED